MPFFENEHTVSDVLILFRASIFRHAIILMTLASAAVSFFAPNPENSVRFFAEIWVITDSTR